MFARRGLNLLFHRLQGLHLAAQAVDLVLDAGGLGFGDIALSRSARSMAGRQVAFDAGLDLRHAYWRPWPR